MRTLKRNQVVFYYANPLSQSEPILDSEGNDTGELSSGYADPVKAKGNISPANGRISREIFGFLEGYEKVLVPDSRDCPITENSHLWVDNLDTAHPHDYEVFQIAASLNGLAVALKKVAVSA